MAVRKPVGLKSPDIQKEVGFPWKHHWRNCWSRSSNSVNQNPSVLDSQDTCTKTQRK